jgi:acyl-coenzyme A synthetase/AMP-(fatty) acid ligase
LKQTTADAALVSPPICAELAKDPELLEFVASRIETIIYSGGDVPAGFGNPIGSKLQFLNIYGSSEMGNPPLLRAAGPFPRMDWKYIHLHPSLGFEFESVGDDNLFELCQARHPDKEKYQPLFKLYPELDFFRTGDLFSPHPSKPHLWTHRGRADDIIVFLTGEKTNPISMEDHIAGHPEVKAALVAGAQKFQAALLIEPVAEKSLTAEERAQLIERVWPTIQEANKVCPAHAKISKSHILITDPEKPMARAGKGTVST